MDPACHLEHFSILHITVSVFFVIGKPIIICVRCATDFSFIGSPHRSLPISTDRNENDKIRKNPSFSVKEGGGGRGGSLSTSPIKRVEYTLIIPNTLEILPTSARMFRE